MSYGRDPYYIFETADPEGDGTFIEFVGYGRIPTDAIAQLVASMAWRDEQGGPVPGHGGLAEYIERGRELRGWEPPHT